MKILNVHFWAILIVIFPYRTPHNALMLCLSFAIYTNFHNSLKILKNLRKTSENFKNQNDWKKIPDF
jgi:hypothetical protein